MRLGLRWQARSTVSATPFSCTSNCDGVGCCVHADGIPRDAFQSMVVNPGKVTKAGRGGERLLNMKGLPLSSGLYGLPSTPAGLKEAARFKGRLSFSVAVGSTCARLAETRRLQGVRGWWRTWALCIAAGCRR